MNAIAREAEAVRRALDADGDEVRVSLSRETAEWIAGVMDARARGQQILVTASDEEVTPNEAAGLLAMSGRRRSRISAGQ